KHDNAARWQFFTRVGSISFHILFLILLLSWNKIFPQREPTHEETEIARKQLTYLLPGKFDPEPEVRPKPPAPAVKVDPRTIRKVAPPAPKPPPPQPERPKESLPSAPVPKLEASAQPPPSAPEPKPDAPKVQPKLEIPDMPPAQKGLLLP